MGEENAWEYLRNNTLAARSFAETCSELGGEHFVFISTDKAIHPTSVMGASKRAAEMLRDDLEARGPVRVSEVEGAQKEILAVARRMADAGDLSLGGGGDEFV